MRVRSTTLVAIAMALAFYIAGRNPALAKSGKPKERGATSNTVQAEFRTADRCVACHNGLKTPNGNDVSIGLEWRPSMMANCSRDPYWQGSVRRESIDHPESKADVEDECSTCHMPVSHFSAHAEGKKAEVFTHLPFSENKDPVSAGAQDGVTCSVCHQIENHGLGTAATYDGNVTFAAPADKILRPEFGPFVPTGAHQRIMQSSTAGFVPEQGAHIRDAGLCGSCHTLKTKALGPGGKQVGELPEQMPYQEWQHSDYYNRLTCQECHMPVVIEPAPITAIYPQLREGVHRHEFIGGNFFMQLMLKDHRDELSVAARPEELESAVKLTYGMLQTQAARVSIPSVTQNGKSLAIEVLAVNLTGHKLPTAYPSRRAWLHVKVSDGNGQTVFESGALRQDGSIVGNDNDADPRKFEPHYREINSPDQVQIFEPILKDSQGKVTTGLLSAVGYLKDSRLLPSGFNKQSAEHDIAVVGAAYDDPNFTDKGSVTNYVVDLGDKRGPFHVEAELWYQPIGFRWAHNLEPYKAEEPQRFVRYYSESAGSSATVLARAEASH